MSAILSTSPEPISRILDAAFRLYFRTLKPCFLVGIIPALLQAVPIFFLLSVDPEKAATAPWLAIGVGAAVAYVIAVVAALILNGALIDYQGMLGRGFDRSISQSIWASVRRVPAMLGAVVLLIVALLLGVLAFIIGAVVVMVMLYFWVYAMMLEGSGVLACLQRSWQLVKGNFWRVSAILLVPFAVQMALSGIVSMVLLTYLLGSALSGGGEPPTAAQLQEFQGLAQLISAPITALTMPLWTAVGVAMFNDLVVRAEGGDLIARIEDGNS